MSGHDHDPVDVSTLAELLHETAEHHDAFEKATPQHDWWDWYAPYLDARLRGSTSEEATRTADRYMQEVRDVVRGSVDSTPDSTLDRPPRPPWHELDTILVALDDSPAAAQATEFAIDLAAEHHAKLIFVHVIPALDFINTGDEEIVALPHEPAGRERAMLDDAAHAATTRGVPATTTLLPGPAPADEIVAHGESNHVDLIVIGSCGHGAIRRTLLGSVSLGVLRKSTRPVLVIRGDIAFGPLDETLTD